MMGERFQSLESPQDCDGDHPGNSIYTEKLHNSMDNTNIGTADGKLFVFIFYSQYI